MNLDVVDSSFHVLVDLRLSVWTSAVQLGAAQLGIDDGSVSLFATITCPTGCRQVGLDALKVFVTPVREVRHVPGFCS